MVGRGRRWELTAATSDSGDFLEHFFIFSGIPPLLVPVKSSAVLPLSTLDRCFEDEFCNVLGWRAVNTTVCKVLNHGTAVLADGAEVKSVSATVEGQAMKTTINSCYNMCTLFETYIMSNSWIRIDEG